MPRGWRFMTAEQREAHNARDRERRRNLTGEQREAQRARDRERERNLTDEQRVARNARRRERYRGTPISFLTLIKHSSSSWIILYSALYYALTIITTPLARVFNEYKKRKALRAVRELRCDGNRYRRLVLNFRCGLGNNNPYHGAVASVHPNMKREIDAAIDLGGFVDDTTKKRLRALVLNTRGLHVFLCHHIRDDGAVVAHVCASKYPKEHRYGKQEARRTFVKNGIAGDDVTIITLAHHWFGYHGENLEEVVQRALYKEPDAEPSEEEDYSSDEVDPLID